MASKTARWNGIQWVVVSDTDDINSKLVQPPAEAGTRSDAAGFARFGHISASDEVGHIVSADGTSYVIEPAGANFYVYNRKAGGHDLRMQAGPAGVDVGNTKIGPRSDAVTEAHIGYYTQHGSVGSNYSPSGNIVQITANGQPIHFYERDAAGTGHTLYANFTNTFSQLNGWGLGTHPVYGANYRSLWQAGAGGAADYAILNNVVDTYVNARNNVYLRTSNSDQIVIAGSASPPYVVIQPHLDTGWIYCRGLIQSTGDGTNSFYGAGGKLHQLGGPVWGNYGTTGVWDSWGVLAYSAFVGGTHTGVHHYGTAAVGWRVHSGHGENLHAVNAANNQYAQVGASGYATFSSLTIKRDIRPLGDRERIVVEPLDPASDVVVRPDIMGLRPMAYRTKGLAQKIVPAEGYDEYIGDKPETWRLIDWPIEEVHGRESRRERLGLIAEEVQFVIPSAVQHNNDTGEALSIDYNQVVVALLDHVQRLTDEVATLRYRVTELEGALS